MQTAMHPAFQQKLAVLAALLERSKSARTEAQARIDQPAPRYQAVAKGNAWHIIEIATGKTKGFCFSYPAAMRFVDAMEAAAASKQGGLQ